MRKKKKGRGVSVLKPTIFDFRSFKKKR